MIKKNAKINLAIICGGPSSEHEVSLASAKSVISNLDQKKYNILLIVIDRQGKWLLGPRGEEYLTANTKVKTIANQLAKEESQSLINISSKELTNFQEGDLGGQKIDLVLPIGHGQYIEDGKLQGMLDMLGIPYVFSGTLTSALAMNKHLTKIIAQAAGLTICLEQILKSNDQVDLDKIITDLGLPVVIKPVELGSSVGISIPKNKADLEVALANSFKLTNTIMVEKYVKGRELTCAVLGNDQPQTLPVVEIIPKVSEFFDYKAKYEVGGSEEICPANIPEAIRNQVQKQAIKIFQALGCSDLARADFIWDEKNNQLYFLEINTIPGMTQTSLVPQEAKVQGLEFPQFLDTLITEALKRYNKE